MATKTKTVKVCGYRSNEDSPQSWWVDTGIFVQQGHEIEIDASSPGGVIKPWPTHAGFGPIGEEGTDWPEALANQHEEGSQDTCWFGSLIGKIGRDGQAFSVGTSRILTADRSGTLFLAFNDGSNFEDNSGHWNVNVTFEELVHLGDGYGDPQFKIYADRVNGSLVDKWGIILTVQTDVTDPELMWEDIAVNNVDAACQAVHDRLQTLSFPRTFKQVFGGLELRFYADSTYGWTHNERLVRFGSSARTTVTRNDNRAFGRINAPSGLDYYQSEYGFFSANSKGIQNTIIHELGHVLHFRCIEFFKPTAEEFNLGRLKDVNEPNFDSTLDVGTFWEHGDDNDLGEWLPDHFLNWVRDSYVGIEGEIDDYNEAETTAQLRVSAFWLGNIEFQGSVSPGMSYFASAASPFFTQAEGFLQRVGIGTDPDPDCLL